MHQCEYCKNQFIKRKKTARFCSRNCLYKWMHEFSPQKTSKEVRLCKTCQRTFEVFCTSSRTFCNARCYHQSRIGSKLSEEHKRIISETRKIDWANGKYKNAIVGKTKWYDHVKPNGQRIRLQGSWELLYAKYLDQNQIEYEAHKGAIWYVRSSDLTKRVYLPDFWLPKTEEFIDIKNDHLLIVDKQKIEDVKTCNQNLKLRIITKSTLMELGILTKGL